MRVCIVAFANIRVTPYLHKYADLCAKNGIKYDVIYWDRYLLSEKPEGCENLYTFEKEMHDSANIVTKLIMMYRYSCFVKSVLKKNNYDRVVVLTSLPGVFLESYLTKKMPGKYIFDIRDYSYEHIKWYYGKMESLMKNSVLNIVSSRGFLKFLPKCEASVLNNCTYTETGDEDFKKKNDGRLVISFVGLVRFASECKKFLKCIANDERMEFHFRGNGEAEGELKEFCRENGIENVFFHGAYPPEKKGEICMEADLMFNAYGNTLNLKYALSNKYYDALYYKKPLVVSPDTIMEELSEGFSYSVDYGTNVADGIMKWYDSLKAEEINNLAEKYLADAINENEETERNILKALKNE